MVSGISNVFLMYFQSKKMLLNEESCLMMFDGIHDSYDIFDDHI